MKRLTTYLFFSLTLLILISCSSNKGTGDNDPPPPENISISKSNLSFATVLTAMQPTPYTITVTNKSTDTISCMLIKKYDWVKLDKSKLTLAPNVSTVFDVTTNVTGDMLGDYADTIKIYNPNSDRVEKRIYVNVTVIPDTTGIRILNNHSRSEFVEKDLYTGRYIYNFIFNWTVNPYSNAEHTFKITKYQFRDGLYIHTWTYENYYLHHGDMREQGFSFSYSTILSIGALFEFEFRIYYEILGVEDYRAFLLSFTL